MADKPVCGCGESIKTTEENQTQPC